MSALTPEMRNAAESGDLEAIVALIEAGADPNAKNQAGNTALHAAAYRGVVGAIVALLASGADRDARNVYGVTALATAMREGRDDAADALRDASDSRCPDHSVRHTDDRAMRRARPSAQGDRLRARRPCTEDPRAGERTAALQVHAQELLSELTEQSCGIEAPIFARSLAGREGTDETAATKRVALFLYVYLAALNGLEEPVNPPATTGGRNRVRTVRANTEGHARGRLRETLVPSGHFEETDCFEWRSAWRIVHGYCPVSRCIADRETGPPRTAGASLCAIQPEFGRRDQGPISLTNFSTLLACSVVPPSGPEQETSHSSSHQHTACGRRTNGTSANERL